LKESSFTVHDLPKPERPRERLKQFGPEVLPLNLKEEKL
jgi:DNA repair protein RadC